MDAGMDIHYGRSHLVGAILVDPLPRLSGWPMTPTPRTTFYVHLAATLAMTGIIWFIQVVHYPLFDHVPVAAFHAYETDHTRLTTLVVIPLMLVEALTGVVLLWRRPAAVPRSLVLIGIGLLGVIWVSTALLQVPQHLILAKGFNAAAHHVLVTSNWIRTIAWSARSLLVLQMTVKATPS